MSNEKRAPVQGYSAGIPWSMHLRAYDAYVKKWGRQEALIDLEGRNCRGGFSVGELDGFIPGWREELSDITRLTAERDEARADYARRQRDVGDWSLRALEAEARCSQLEAALMPLAKEFDARAHLAPGPDIDHWPLGGTALTYRDARVARAVLTQERGTESVITGWERLARELGKAVKEQGDARLAALKEAEAIALDYSKDVPNTQIGAGMVFAALAIAEAIAALRGAP